MVRPSTYRSTGEMPLLPDFDLLKIHPLEHGMMMGVYPQLFLSEEESWELLQESGGGQPPPGFYKYLAASLAYGHMAMVGYDYDPPPARVIQLYALMQGVQAEYLTDTVARIEYHDGQRFVSTSQALRDDTVRVGRVHVAYSRGLQVHVNYRSERTWTVAVDGRAYELPPYGWVISKPGEILAFSALLGGHRVDYVDCREYLYMNSGARPARFGPLRVDGAVLVKRPAAGQPCRVIPCGNLGKWESFAPEGYPADMKDRRLAGMPADRGCKLLQVDTRVLLGRPAAQVQVRGRDEDGAEVAGPAPEQVGPHLRLPVSAAVVDYTLE